MRKGRIGVIAQSGGINISLSLLIGRLGEGISLAVGLGNAVDVWFDDVLAAMADDSNTAVIVVGLEGIPQGRKLFDAVRAATTRKPVVALVAGRADIQEFAMSHTGNLMGSYQRTVAALTQAGAVIVDSSEAAAQAACVLANGRLSPRERPRIALVTGQAGPGLLIMDGLKSAGIEMPVLNVETIRRVQSYLPQLTFVKNPVDTGLPLPCFPEIVDAVAADSQIDVVLAFSLAETVVVDSAPALAAVKKKAGKPFVFGTLGESDDLHEMIETLHKEAIPVVQSPERLALAGVVLAADARACWRLSHTDVVDELLPQPRLEGEFDEHRAKTILEHYGICTPKRVLCQSLEDAVAAFRTLQKPVVVKIAAADITHKTEAGGVHLNIINEHQLSKAVYALGRIPTRYPGRFLVEELAPSGVELIVGGLRDESWGPIVMLGLGGILAEALEDTAIRLAPVSKLDVDEMLDSLRGRKLFDGFRNLPVCDRAAIHQAVLAISQLLTEHPEVREVEINPLLVYASGAVALDAILGLRDGSGDKDRQESTRCRE
ncbi:MAG: acetate--CoA ligase family protein [Candidatus Korobacteraceae bacterium]